MKKAIIQLDTLTCPSCSLKIESAVKKLDGVEKESVSVSFNTSKVKLNFDEGNLKLEEIKEAIVKLGYDVLNAKEKD